MATYSRRQREKPEDWTDLEWIDYRIEKLENLAEGWLLPKLNELTDKEENNG